MKVKKLAALIGSVSCLLIVCAFPSFAAGWQQDEHGTWYQEDDLSYPADTWREIEGSWYHFDADGYRQTGWQNIYSKWYYLMPDTGVMVADTTMEIDGVSYTFDASGAWIEKVLPPLGHWADPSCYANEWANYQFTLTETLIAASPEELRSIDTDTSTFDLYVKDLSNSSTIAIGYDDVNTEVFQSMQEPQDYLNYLRDFYTSTQLWQFDEITTVNFGSETYYKLHAYFMGGLGRQDFYCRKIDHYLMSIVVSSSYLAEPEVNALLNQNLTSVR